MPSEVLTAMVHFPYQGQRVPGYLARPKDEEKHPGIVVIQEWWGLVDHIKDVAQRFAQEGFVALAPDLYHGKETFEPDEARKLSMELDQPRAVQEIESALAYLMGQPFSNGEKPGVIGYCMGGGLTLLTGCKSQRVGGIAVYYGRNPNPIDQVANLSCPMLGIYGKEDRGIPPSEVERLRAALTRYEKKADIHIYPKAGHAFFNDECPSYAPEAAKDAWSCTPDFFRANLQ